MPRYQYRCTACEKDLLITHLSDESPGPCPGCTKPDTLIKRLTNFHTPLNNQTRQKQGAITEEFIKEARLDLKHQKKELTDKR